MWLAVSTKWVELAPDLKRFWNTAPILKLEFIIIEIKSNGYVESYSSHSVSWAEPGNCVIDKAQCIEFGF